MTSRAAAETACTWLFVPGERPERFEKAAACGADVVILDLEDAVSRERKDAARTAVIAWASGASVPWAVRINAAGTAWHDADLAAVRTLGPAIVVVPKAETAEDLARIAEHLSADSVVVALVETALGVISLPELAAVPQVARLALGTYDLAAQLGVDPDSAAALASSRAALVLASAANGLAAPVDGVTGDVADVDALTRDVAAAVELGFSGKLCIHPAQVGRASRGFAPSSTQLAWAERILSAAAATGDAALLVDGRMVDAPVITRARRVVAAASSSGALR